MLLLEPPPGIEATPAILESPLKYLGKKDWISERIGRIYQDHWGRRWNDLFCGSCEMPLRIEPPKVLINDVNPDLMAVWAWIKGGGERLIPFDCSEKAFYDLRATLNKLKPESVVDDRGELFYLLNRAGHRALVRYNNNGEYNVPFGHYDPDRVQIIEDFSPYAKAMQHWELYNREFNCVPIDPEDFVVADVPYLGTYTEYSGDAFPRYKQAELVRRLAEHPGPVIYFNAWRDRLALWLESLGFETEKIVRPDVLPSGERGDRLELFATKGI
jgi:DNA adenine methylase